MHYENKYYHDGYQLTLLEHEAYLRDPDGNLFSIDEYENSDSYIEPRLVRTGEMKWYIFGKKNRSPSRYGRSQV